MRKTLQDVASYLKEIIVPETHEEYAIKSAYTNISAEESIQEGVLAFRLFLCRIYDVLIAAGNAYDNSKKVAHEYENRTSLSVYYPFLHNVNTLLIRIGYYGMLTENEELFVSGNAIFSEKLSVSKNLECLLSNRLRNFIGDMNVNEKKQNMSAIKSVTVTYPDNPVMLTGLRTMVIAETDHRTLIN